MYPPYDEKKIDNLIIKIIDQLIDVDFPTSMTVLNTDIRIDIETKLPQLDSGIKWEKNEHNLKI